MMGASHAVSGAAAWVAVTATAVPAFGLYPLEPGAVILGAFICAGAALLPDADHPNATIAHSVPVAGKVVAGAVGGLTGGHRKGMHSLVAVLAITFAMFWVGELTWTPSGWDREVQIGAAVAAGACIAFAAKVVKVTRSWMVAWLIGVVFAVLVGVAAPENTAWLPWCIGVGYLVHLIGDALTAGGVPFTWPITPKPPKAWKSTPVLSSLWLPNGAVAIPVLGLTGSWREWALSSALSLYTLWGLSMTGITGIQSALAS